jgi:penicillin-binding protein 2
LPDAAYKQKATGEGWFAGDDANFAIGQGFLTVTPLQMAVVTAAVANGGDVLRPYLVESVRTSAGAVVRKVQPEVRGRVTFKPEHLKRIREGMKGAVAYGTATRAFDPHLVLAGKTGTVENIATADNPQGRNHTWFCCYGPINEKNSLVVVVFLEKSGGYGGALAAPIARDVVASWERMKRQNE